MYIVVYLFLCVVLNFVSFVLCHGIIEIFRKELDKSNLDFKKKRFITIGFILGIVLASLCSLGSFIYLRLLSILLMFLLLMFLLVCIAFLIKYIQGEFPFSFKSLCLLMLMMILFSIGFEADSYLLNLPRDLKEKVVVNKELSFEQLSNLEKEVLKDQLLRNKKRELEEKPEKDLEEKAKKEVEELLK